ncbi:MAG TPA: HAMP domain-containing sensor histidine kinase [Candidatus Saccharimonadia bacterium]
MHKEHPSNLQRHFIMWVLLPPFGVFLALSILGLWQLEVMLHRQAIGDLQRASTATAANVNQQFSLHETVLKQMGTELFVIKNEYRTNRKNLEDNYNACRAYLLKYATPKLAPNGTCQPFLGGLGTTGNLVALEDEHVRLVEKLIQNQNQRINERLAAFKEFFPETLALLITDGSKQTVSSALSGAFQGSTLHFQADAEAALSKPIRGKIAEVEGFKMAIFGFPIGDGSVIAAYDLQNKNFVRRTWSNAPVDKTRELVVLLDSSGKPAYPQLRDGKQFAGKINDLRHKPFVHIKLDNVDHTVVGTPIAGSDWMAVVASPTAAIHAASRDAQLAGLMLIGLFMIGFLWVGTFFIQRTLRNIINLALGAQIFGSGKLDHTITLKHGDGEFLQLADTMNGMARRIAAAEQAIDEKNKEFISIATHELRSPLTAMIINLSAFQEMHVKNLDDEARHYADEAYASTIRLRDLVNDMLSMARLESGNPEFTIDEVDIDGLVKNIVDMMSGVAAKSKVELSYQDKSVSKVMADEQYLRVILNNFVSNAIKYNRPGGKVVISHELKGDKLVTIVADSGLGIPDPQKAHIFEKFFRIRDTDRKDIPGTGLGMYITKQYIEQMHGEVWFESTHGKGTTFYFTLPVAKKPPS